jgi:hypothetical protein
VDTLPYLVEAVDARLAATLEQRLELWWRSAEHERWHDARVLADCSPAKCVVRPRGWRWLGATLAGMDGLGEPRDQPIGMLPTIAHLIDEGLADTSEQYATMLEARPKPWVLDDALINRSKRVNGEALEWCGVYDRQLTRWLSQHLTPAQRREVITRG